MKCQPSRKRNPQRKMLALTPCVVTYTLRATPVALQASRRFCMSAAAPVPGDVVTVDFSLRPSEARLFDDGKVSFVLGQGNYLPGLHETVATMKPGESMTAVEVDAGLSPIVEP